jgi:hypothetical protein
MRTVSLALTVLAAGLLAAGCGGSGKLQTRGKVLKGGQPLTLPEGEYVRLTFIPVVEAGGKRAEDFYVAEYNRADGSFKVAGKDLKGMPPGKYKVAVEHLKGRNDILKGAFSEDRTPFVYDVKTSADEVTIDLDQKKK